MHATLMSQLAEFTNRKFDPRRGNGRLTVGNVVPDVWRGCFPSLYVFSANVDALLAGAALANQTDVRNLLAAAKGAAGKRRVAVVDTGQARKSKRDEGARAQSTTTTEQDASGASGNESY